MGKILICNNKSIPKKYRIANIPSPKKQKYKVAVNITILEK